MKTRILAALAAMALLMTGCDSGNESASRETTVEPVADSTGPVVLPDLTGMSAADARDQARDLGLAVRALPGSTSVCVPRRSVVRQQPVAGTEVEVGSRVRLRVNVGGSGECGLDLPKASPDLRRVAKLFVAFARDRSGQHGLPAETPVEVFVAGARGTWRAVRAAFLNYPGPIAATSAPPAHPCLRTGPALPHRLDVYRTVTLTPDEPRDCTSYFAVQLFVNDVGQIVAANLVRSEP